MTRISHLVFEVFEAKLLVGFQCLFKFRHGFKVYIPVAFFPGERETFFNQCFTEANATCLREQVHFNKFAGVG